MKVALVLQAAFLFLSTDSMAATVEYNHPVVSIVADGEPLESVLIALGEEMRITVTSPMGLNPVITCDIQNQPVTQAFRKLLGDLSYSLVWAENGDRLTGLVILSDEESSAVADAGASSPANGAIPAIEPSGADEYGPVVSAPGHGSEDQRRAEHEAGMAIEREESEARMAEEREAHELEMSERLREEEIAHEARRKEEVERQEAEARAYLESHGVQVRW